jgi:hypothetical protein
MKCLFCNNQLTNEYCQSCNVKHYDRNEVWIDLNHLDTSFKCVAQYFADSKKLYLLKNNKLIHVIINMNPNLKEINRFISKFIKMQHFL